MAAQQQIKREDNDCRKQPLHDDLRSQHVIGDGVAGGAMGTGVVRSGLLTLLHWGGDALDRRTETAEQRKDRQGDDARSEEHASELQSLMRISYAVFCLTKKRH